MPEPLSCVRLAASRLPVLLSFRLYAVGYVVLTIGHLAAGRGMGDNSPLAIPLGVLVALWFVMNRRNGLWVERDRDGIRLRKRRGWRSDRTGRGPISAGALVAEYPIDTEIIYDPTPTSWWRVDRALTIDGTRLSVYPEGRELAEAMTDQSLWGEPAAL